MLILAKLPIEYFNNTIFPYLPYMHIVGHVVAHCSQRTCHNNKPLAELDPGCLLLIITMGRLATTTTTQKTITTIKTTITTSTITKKNNNNKNNNKYYPSWKG